MFCIGHPIVNNTSNLTLCYICSVFEATKWQLYVLKIFSRKSSDMEVRVYV